MALSPGSLVANRFLIDKEAGTGGMGTVYRARDLQTDRWVALKLLSSSRRAGSAQDSARFAREAQILSELRHPNIVAYIDHGQAADGQRYLAMEWLEGHDLAQRLAAGPLPIADSILLLRGAAEALLAAHERGIIHRDLKPSNMFLPGGLIANLKLLDFGIARWQEKAKIMTHTGLVMGTPEYMAPEQARGVRDLTPAADVFSLGCVLYECLTGTAPFIAAHVAAVILRILFEEPKPVTLRRPDVSAPLAALVHWMLAKDAKQRPQNARELLTLLAALPSGASSEPQAATLPGLPAATARPTQSIGISDAEQQLISVILVSETPWHSCPETLSVEQFQSFLAGVDQLRAAVTPYGAELECLASGALVATVRPDGHGAATDQVFQAARTALALHERRPGAFIALTTGRGMVRERLPIGEVIDRAVQLLQRHFTQPNPEPSSDGVFIDEVTAALLDRRAQVVPCGEGGFMLYRGFSDGDALKPLLGRPTPCVGREPELTILQGTLATCIDEAVSRAVLITAPAGTGKSRLRHEFLRRVSASGVPMQVLSGCSDPMSTTSSYGLLRQVFYRLCGILEGEPLADQWRKLRERVSLRLPAADELPVAGLIGELCQIPFPGEAPAELQQARQDPLHLGEQITRAWLKFLHAESSALPVVLVLEDLQWADPLSIKLVERTVYELADRSLLVVAMARPEVKERFPALWSRRLLEIPLSGLSRKASERLVCQFLGVDATPQVVARIVEQAAGNVLFLEELIRAFMEGKRDELPRTVLAILQARIVGLDAPARRLLRAASIFGQTFWRGGVQKLLGAQYSCEEVSVRLSELTKKEILEQHRDSRFSDDEEYAFHHALLREAAYGLLTDEDRRAGHRQAARYLERKQEADPIVLAEHYRRGGDVSSAVPLYLRAGEAATRISALPEARDHYATAHALLRELPDTSENRRLMADVLLKQVQLALLEDISEQSLARMMEARSLLSGLCASDAAGEAATGKERAADLWRAAWVDYLCGRIHLIQGEPAVARTYCERVLPVAEGLADEHLKALALHLIGSTLLVQGEAQKSRPWLERAVALPKRDGGEFERLRALGIYGISLVMSGAYREGMAVHEQVLARAAEINQPASLGMLNAHLCFSLQICGDYPRLLETAQRTLDFAQRIDDPIFGYIGLHMLGWAHSCLGQAQEAACCREHAQKLIADRGGRVLFADLFAAADADMALRAGDADKAVALAEELAPGQRKAGQLWALGLLEQVWGLALLRRNQPVEAEAHLRAALAIMEGSEQKMAAALLRLQWSHLCHLRGAAEQAATLHSQAAAQFAASGGPELLQQAQLSLDGSA